MSLNWGWVHRGEAILFNQSHSLTHIPNANDIDTLNLLGQLGLCQWLRGVFNLLKGRGRQADRERREVIRACFSSVEWEKEWGYLVASLRVEDLECGGGDSLQQQHFYRFLGHLRMKDDLRREGKEESLRLIVSQQQNINPEDPRGGRNYASLVASCSSSCSSP